MKKKFIKFKKRETKKIIILPPDKNLPVRGFTAGGFISFHVDPHCPICELLKEKNHEK